MNRAYLTGLLFALAAYAAWGILPLYWALLRHVSPVEVLAHRVIWTLPFAAAMVGLARQWDELAGLLRRPRTMLVLAATALLIALNWWLYIWAVTNGRMLEASLGYYLTPLVTVLLGLAAFGERPKPLQWLAIMLATAGVALILIGEGLLPWVSLALAFSFGLYGALRKHVRADAAVGLFVETALLLPLFLGWLFQLLVSGRSAFLSINFSTDLLQYKFLHRPAAARFRRGYRAAAALACGRSAQAVAGSPWVAVLSQSNAAVPAWRAGLRGSILTSAVVRVLPDLGRRRHLCQ
ncbi:MAG: EamA family transporter RarD [Xanthomonadaceae bacterium]|nr:EamA family transporter RarD [Xanthomonadaceae bacterium]